MKRILSILLLLSSICCFPQFSKTHYIPPISLSADQPPQEQFLYISCPSLTPVAFRILEIGGNIIEGTVTRDNPYVHSIGSGFFTQLVVDPSDVSSVQTSKGFIVEAEDMVYVTVRLTATTDHFQAGGIVSKGLAALGTQFRVGAFTNTDVEGGQYTTFHFTFASILATENNTTVHFDDIKPGAVLLNDQASGNTPSDVTLNRGESFIIAVRGPTNANRDALIGSLISSDKPIAVTCGSASGSNGTSNLDLGMDQIVSAERTGRDYIFIKGNGPDTTERPMIVAHYDNTEVYLSGDATPVVTLDAGEYYAPYGGTYTAGGNLFIHTSQDAFAYQGIGGTLSQANQNLSFVPPLRCETPKIINNIPYINRVGNDSGFTGNVAIVTETGAELSFIINGIEYTLDALPNSITVDGPTAVEGNLDFVTYTFQGLDGNISVFSTKQVYLSYFGSSGAATYGGFYSGFTFKPEVSFGLLDTESNGCIPNTILRVNALNAFDQFQWYFNGNPIAGATQSTYQPAEVPTGLGPGFYHVKASIAACGTELISDTIPVSSCAVDFDGDSANDNYDLDLDNDGITNCVESYGDLPFDLTTTATQPLAIGNYSNSYSHAVSGTGPQAAVPFTGNSDGSFITEVAAGLNNGVALDMSFTHPVSVAIRYVETAAPGDLITPYGDFVASVPPGYTLTVNNPDDNLLVDTNYDGIYENGIVHYSSFQIRFRLNSSVPLAPNLGTFSISGHDIPSMTLLHKNGNDNGNDRATFRIVATCVPVDNDGDGIPDQLDGDSDNDGVSDLQEGIGPGFAPPPTFVDANGDGLEDLFPVSGSGFVDTDGDGFPDRLDRDSDNDGIYDLVESGRGATDTDFDGAIDGSKGANGIADSIETAPDSGTFSTPVADTDGDDIANYIDKDSDGDDCFDVTEAGFSDPDNDGVAGNGTPTVGASGVVTSVPVYTAPNADVIVAAPISITTMPADVTECENQQAVFTTASNGDAFTWQLSTDGISYTDLSDGALYSGTGTPSLTVSDVLPSMEGYRYRVKVDRTGNACGKFSDAAVLHVNAKPIVPATATLVQCDDDTDGLSDFNLTEKEGILSANAASETFSYYFTEAGALNADTDDAIPDPTLHSNAAAATVWVRTENADGCFDTTRLDLVVSVTQIPPGTSWSFARCDDYIDAANDDHDGMSTFDFSSVTTSINGMLGNPSNYTISYYNNEADALAEENAISDTVHYRNTDSPVEFIWVRVDSKADNACYGLGPYVRLTVEEVPIAHPVTVAPQCDYDLTDTDVTYPFGTSAIQAQLLGGQTDVTITYTDAAGNNLGNTLPDPFLTATQNITARLTNNSTAAPDGPCFDETIISFVVNARPIANPVSISPECDADGDGKHIFDTSGIEAAILAGQTGFSVTYTSSDGTLLPSPLPLQFETANDTITVRVSNPADATCSATTELAFEVNPVPQLDDDYTSPICTGLVTGTAELDAGLLQGSRSAFTYRWTKDGSPIASTYAITVHDAGAYAVTVTDRDTGCTSVRTITLVYSQAATIGQVIIEDLRDHNTVDVIATGPGDYRYRLDDGPYTDNPLFTDVEPGIHEVYVTDANGCGTVSQTIAVVGAMTFFTPNGDSYNDYWRIKGVSSLFHKNSTVYIFDRYGRLLSSIPTGSDPGWDGVYNGQPLPADDYWFVLHLDDGREWRGHFTLKR